MGIQAEKYLVIEELMKVQDITLITQVKNMLRNSDKVLAYKSNGQPITEPQMRAEIIEAKERINSGQFTTQDDLDREVENW